MPVPLLNEVGMISVVSGMVGIMNDCWVGLWVFEVAVRAVYCFACDFEGDLEDGLYGDFDGVFEAQLILSMRSSSASCLLEETLAGCVVLVWVLANRVFLAWKVMVAGRSSAKDPLVSSAT